MSIEKQAKPPTWHDVGTMLCAIASHIEGDGLMVMSRICSDATRADILRRAIQHASAVDDLARLALEAIEKAEADKAGGGSP